MKGCTRMRVTKFQERHPELPCVTPDDFIVDTKAQKFVTTKGDAHAHKADSDCSHIWSSMAVCGSQSSCQYIYSVTGDSCSMVWTTHRGCANLLATSGCTLLITWAPALGVCLTRMTRTGCRCHQCNSFHDKPA